MSLHGGSWISFSRPELALPPPHPSSSLSVCVGSLLRTCAARVVPAVTATPATPATLATLALLLAFTIILVAHLLPEEVAPLWQTFMALALLVVVVACCIIILTWFCSST